MIKIKCLFRAIPCLAAGIVLVLTSGCQGGADRNIPDVSDISVDIELRRFEQALFQADTTDMAAVLEGLQSTYPQFAPVFFGELLGAYDSSRVSNPTAYIKGFVQHPPLRQLYDTVQIVYPDMTEYEAAFEEAFRYYQYYFPDAPVPSVTTFISEYSVAAFIYADNDLAVGLDYFLGEAYPYRAYNPGHPAFANYLARTYTPAHLVSKTLQTLVEDIVPPPRQARLLDLMIHNGKKLYLLDLLQPYTPDSIKLEMTAAQVEWLENNESEMWKYFIKEDLLYDTDWAEIRKLVDYSPNSPGMPPEAPGRSANWMGWQIIKTYMRAYPDETIQDLLTRTDAQVLLDASKYKPR